MSKVTMRKAESGMSFKVEEKEANRAAVDENGRPFEGELRTSAYGEELRAREGYKGDELRRVQLIELDILKEVDRICREKGITYWLDSGTCLGAMRHQGFIPWDDDIDIGMLRPDYDRFLSLAPRLLPENYVLSDPLNNPRQAVQFAKVWKRGTRFMTQEDIDAGNETGIFLDIFPFDVLSKHRERRIKQERGARTWQSVSYVYHSSHIKVPHEGGLGSIELFGCKVAHGLFRKLYTAEYIAGKYDDAVMEGVDDPSSEYMNLSWINHIALPKYALVPTKTALFEGRKFPIPARPEAYLAAYYGANWKELPPRKSHKNHRPFILEFGTSEADNPSIGFDSIDAGSTDSGSM